MLAVVRNPIQDRTIILPLACWQQSREIDPRKHFPSDRRDARNPVGLPDIGEYLSVDKFQLVEVQDRLAMVCNGDVTDLLKRRRIKQAENRTAVAQDQMFVVVG